MDLAPIALLIALFFIQQGVLQNVLPYQPITTLEGVKQLLPMGPVASQEAIKMIGTNGAVSLTLTHHIRLKTLPH